MRTLRNGKWLSLGAFGLAAAVTGAVAGAAAAGPPSPADRAAPVAAGRADGPAGAGTGPGGPAAADPARAPGPTRGPASGGVRPAAAPVAGSWLVTLHPPAGPADVGTLAARLLARYTGVLDHTYRSAVIGFSARMDTAAARRLATDPRVAAVEQDAVVRTAGTQTTTPGTWGLDRIDQRTLPLDGRYTHPDPATTVHAYVVDTGISTTHTDFGGRATIGTDLVGDGRNGQDCDGHGSHVAGTLGGRTHGVAKHVRLHAVRVLDCDGFGTLADVVAAVDWVTAHAVRPAVVNLSLALTGPAPVLDQAITAAVAAGLPVTVAAGNSSDGANRVDACGHSPARAATALTVGATTRADARSDFSEVGRCLDLFAPGSGVTSAWVGSDEATRTVDGTSMAAPHVAGAVALHLAAHPAATPAEVRAALLGAATRGVLSGVPADTTDALLHVGGPTPSPTAGPTGTAAPRPTSWPGMPSGGPTTGPTTGPTGGPTGPAQTGPAPTTGPGGQVNETDVPIPDLGTARSTITVSTRPGRAPAALRVTVRIVHPYRGDLAVSLRAPDGRTYRVKTPSFLDRAADYSATVPVNASASPGNGVWTLVVRDMYARDTGHLDRWGLS